MLSRLYSVVLAAGVVLGFIGMSPARAQPAAKTVRDTVALPPSGTVAIDSHRGSITVTTWNRTKVGYAVRIEPATEGDDLPFTSLDTTYSTHKLTLDAEFPWRLQLFGVLTISPGGTERASFHYTVRLPDSARLQIEDHASEIDVSDVDGHTVIDTHAGTVTGTALGGGFTLDTYEGSARVSFSALTAPISIDTHTGPVRLTLPSDAGFSLDTDLQSADQLSTSSSLSLPPPTGPNYSGPVNGGGPTLLIESYDAPVELRTP